MVLTRAVWFSEQAFSFPETEISHEAELITMHLKNGLIGSFSQPQRVAVPEPCEVPLRLPYMYSVWTASPDEAPIAHLYEYSCDVRHGSSFPTSPTGRRLAFYF